MILSGGLPRQIHLAIGALPYLLDDLIVVDCLLSPAVLLLVAPRQLLLNDILFRDGRYARC